MRVFNIYRYDPDKDVAPRMQRYQIDVHPGDRMLLDVLIRLKAMDPTLSFRRSCREGVCGSDAMNINGKNGLACLTNMTTLPQTVTLKPLPGLPVVRDLFVDMTGFFKQYHSVKPWLMTESPPPSRERLQSSQAREELNGLYECILCACCSSAFFKTSRIFWPTSRCSSASCAALWAISATAELACFSRSRSSWLSASCKRCWARRALASR